MNVVILGCGQMLMNLIAGCMDAGCEIVGVFRYDKVRYPAIDQFFVDLFNPSCEYNYIKSHKLHEINARSANSAEFKKEILKLNADIVLVGTWGEKLKKSIINLPKLATINVHPSLLPKYRGPNPYLQAIKHLETKSGVTFHLMDEDYDTGAILLQKTVTIEPTDTGTELRKKTASASREGVCELLKTLDSEIIIPIAQDEKHASYFTQISEDDVMLDFSKSAQEVSAHIRAFHPWFKCYFPYKKRFFIPNPYELEILENNSKLQSIRTPHPNPPPQGREGTAQNSKLPLDKTDVGTIIEKDHKCKSITVLCGDNRLLKMSEVRLYGYLSRFFTAFYINNIEDAGKSKK